MTFLNKQEDVIDIKLTSYGKKLLSKGSFKPVYYGFYDDDVIYKRPDEHQNNSESRIKEQLQLKTIAEAVGAETRFEIQKKKIQEGQLSIYEEFEEDPDPISSGKLLQYELSKQSLETQRAPRITFEAIQGSRIDVERSKNYLEILSSSVDTAGGNIYNIPQLVIESTYRIIEDRTNMADSPADAMITPEDGQVNLMSEKIDFLDGTILTVQDDKIRFSMVEDNVHFCNENFEIEFYEIIEENNKEQLIQIETMEELTKLFTIKTDETIDNYSSVRGSRAVGFFGFT